ncbi:hypothetical protein B0H19DRAFT_1070960 [Mycena capillaripes]|nr:hypothetical protein B0H19DRAFT_1070960 [Mycena capillaripes]
MSVRHPNLARIRGAANCGGLHATLLHDDLIPFKYFVDLQPSHFSKVSIYIYCTIDFRVRKSDPVVLNVVFLTMWQAARNYLSFTSGQWLRRDKPGYEQQEGYKVAKSGGFTCGNEDSISTEYIRGGCECDSSSRTVGPGVALTRPSAVRLASCSLHAVEDYFESITQLSGAVKCQGRPEHAF